MICLCLFPCAGLVQSVGKNWEKWEKSFKVSGVKVKSEKTKVLRGKECEVMNYLPYFKEPLIDTIKRYTTIKKYAFICHDKDYNEKGVLESPHWHIYLNFGRASVRFDMVAKWFGIEPQYVNNEPPLP